jgi:hypothetical protein
MTAATRLVLLGAALMPYVALVSVDAWMHERARRVPRLEQFFHAAAAVMFLGFVFAVFRGAATLALALFAVFAVCTACDELGFHRHLAARERRVHFVAYVALAVFLGAWRWTEVAA